MQNFAWGIGCKIPSATCGKGVKDNNMSKKYDLLGQRFGKLTVIGREMDKKGTPWRCVCDCGGEKLASTNHLISGNTSSCGCLRSEVKIKDITGNRYGRLTAVKRAGRDVCRSQVWICKCDCGNTCEVTAGNLKSGATNSCGCIQAETRSKAMKNAKEHRAATYIDDTDIHGLLQSPGRNNTTGHVGVQYHKAQGLWKAHIQFKKKYYYLGSSKSKDVAIALRKEAEQRLHGEFLDWYYGHTGREQIISQLSEKQSHPVPEGYSFEVGV